jgi:serpin B
MTRWNAQSIGCLILLTAPLVGLGCGSEVDPSPSPDPVAQVGSEVRSDKPFDTKPSVDAADFDAFIDGSNAFGFDLYRKLADGSDANLFYSPLSTTMALAMTYAGAAGSTETQMASVLHNALPKATYHLAMNKLAVELGTRSIAPHETEEGTKSVKLLPANASWAQKEYAILPGYLDTLSMRYDAGQHLVDFIGDTEGARLAINDWVEARTEQRIVDLLAPGSLDSSTRLVLTNALYFYGSWAEAFDKDATKDGVFHRTAGDVSTPMMGAYSTLAYAEGDGWQAVSLPYDGYKTEMVVVLPAAGRFTELRGKLDQSWLKQTMSAMTSDFYVDVALPKFKFTWGTESFVPQLKSLGMTDAFVFGQADFSGIEAKRELYIGDVLHKAFVGIDEDGTEAAAATAVVMNAGSMPGESKTFTADRPFMFFVVDATGLVLFTGELHDPTQG